MTVRKMQTIWSWFIRQLAEPYDRLPPPKMKVGPTYIEDHYVWGKCDASLVSVWPFVPRWVVIHEYSHYLEFASAQSGGHDYIPFTAAGRAFADATGGWNMEVFADTLTGLVCGRWRGSARRDKAWLLDPLLLDPLSKG